MIVRKYCAPPSLGIWYPPHYQHELIQKVHEYERIERLLVQSQFNRRKKLIGIMAHASVEPVTLALLAQCSNQLSQ